MKTINLTQMEQMVNDAIKDNNITDVKDFYIEFRKWSYKEEKQIHACLYCKTKDKNINASADNPTLLIELLIDKYKKYNITHKPVELTL